MSCPCYSDRSSLLSLPQTHSVTVPTRTCSWAVSYHFFRPWLCGPWTVGRKHVWPCGFYHCHKQTGCWLAATCSSELLHKHTNSNAHTLWQPSLDSSNIFCLDKHLDQLQSGGPLSSQSGQSSLSWHILRRVRKRCVLSPKFTNNHQFSLWIFVSVTAHVTDTDHYAVRLFLSSLNIITIHSERLWNQNMRNYCLNISPHDLFFFKMNYLEPDLRHSSTTKQPEMHIMNWTKMY